MKIVKFIFSLVLSQLIVFTINAASITGTVVDAASNTPLAGANIRVLNSKEGTVTNKNGNFSLENNTDSEIELFVSYIGYSSLKQKISAEEAAGENIEIRLNATILPGNEVIVSSPRYDIQKKNLALPVAVFTETDISRINALTLSEALGNDAAVSLARDGIWGTHVSIRGLSRQNIITLVDGYRLETATALAAGLSMIDVNDIKRIEVIKGAASAIYGSGALGGVINVITKDNYYAPKFEYQAKIRSAYQSVNKGKSGNLQLNFKSSNWRAKLGLGYRDAENTKTPSGTLENSQFTDQNLSLALGHRPKENHEISLDYQKFHAEDVGIPGGVTFPANATATYPDEDRELGSLTYQIQALSPKFARLSWHVFRQVIDRNVEIKPNAMAIVNPKATHTTNGGQFQADIIFKKNHYLVLGIDAWQRKYEGIREKHIIAQNKIIADRAIPTSTFRSIGMFAQDEFKMADDKIKLVFGGRLDQIKVKNEASFNPEYIIANGVKNENPPNKVQVWAAESENDVSWSINSSLLYKIRPNTHIALNVARAFRSPSLEERFQYIDLGGAVYRGDPDLSPEKSFFLDFGIRNHTDKIGLEFSIFANFLNDLVVDAFVSDNLYRKTNIGQARLWGFDFEANYTLLPSLLLYANGALVRGEDTKFNENLPEMPPLNGKAGIRYYYSSNLNLNIWSNLSADQNTISPDEMKTPGYATANFAITFSQQLLTQSRAEITLAGENLFDRGYRRHLSTFRGLIRQEPGRNVKIQVSLIH